MRSSARTLLLSTLLPAGLAIIPAARAQEAGEPPLPFLSPAAIGHALPDRTRPIQPPGQTLPMMSARRLVADVRHGTWMSLDLSPDGRHIVFDLLGDLYTLPTEGGQATRISGGLPFDTAPAYAPDGRWIAYVSDGSGADNLWIAHPDGSAARQVTFGDDDTVLTSPAWMPDGRSLLVSRYRADLNAYELWRYDLAGHGTLVVPVRDRPDSPRAMWRSTLGAVAAPDGRAVYAARHLGGLSFEDVDHWTIIRRDLATGAEETVVTLPDGPRTPLFPGAFFRPCLSHDGRLLAYAARRDGGTELRVRDLTTGRDRRVAFPITHDQLQSSMWQDLVPRYAFTPDDGAIVLSVGGGFERITLTGGAATPLPFTAHLDVALGPSTRQDIREETGPVHARLMMAPVASPDRRTLAFSALGRLYLMRLDGHAAPVPFASGGDPAFQPAWSPDGRQLTWVTWSEQGAGAIWSAPADGSAPPVRLSGLQAYYTDPVFTPDGRQVLALRSGQQARLDVYMEYGRLRNAELIALPAGGGAARTIARGTLGGPVQFARGAAYLQTDDGLDSIDLVHGTRRLAVRVDGPGWYFQDGAVPVDDLRISPDGHWLLAQVSQQLHLLAMPARPGRHVDLSDPRLPHRRVSDTGADYIAWSADGRSIDWSTGPVFHTRPRADIPLAPPNRPDWHATSPSPAETQYRADVTAPRAVARGRLVLRGARVLTMAAGAPVIDHADILVEDGRFRQVGPTGSFAIPADATIRDVTGRIIVPGFIDTHDHVATIRRTVLGLEDWGIAARLAWGVTTSFDPSTLSIDMLAYQDLLDAGLMTGPRIRQTGIALFSMQRFSSLSDVLAVMRRYRDDYGLRNIKEYRTGSREVREWVAQACRMLGMQPTTEGALSMKLDLTQILDGYAGNEHALVASPLQEDVLALLRATRTSYTTTLSITNGGSPGMDWAIARDDPRGDARVRTFWPELFREQMTLRHDWRPLSEYRFPSIAADAAALAAAGGLVGIGSHGEMPGIGFHQEMELHALGGMTAQAILHAATIGSAETIGRKSDLGSIEPGKIADLVVLTADPLTDIRNARAVAQVMRDGRLYDTATLKELWPAQRPRIRPWFAGQDAEARWLPSPARNMRSDETD